MGLRRMFTLAGSLLMAVLFALPVCGQQTIEAILTGKAVPFTLKIKDLTGGWQQFHLNSGDGMNSLLLSMMASDGKMDPDSMFPIYYSKGEIVTSGEERYLIVYHRKVEAPAPVKGMDRPMPGREMPEEPKASATLTPDTEVVLSLVNLKSITQISDIQPFDFAQEIAAAEKARAEALKQAEVMQKELLVSHVNYLIKSIRRWARNHKGVLPPMKDTNSLLYTLHENATVSTGPGLPAMKISEILLVNPILSGKKLAQFTDAKSMVVLYQRKPTAEGMRLVGFLDGTAKYMKEADWPKLRQASKIAAPADEKAPK